jgi:uncharacterized membrane protein YsdA (DUF1294 family)
MLELASLLLTYVAFAALHAANPARVPWRVPETAHRLWRAALRLIAVGAFIMAIALWHRLEASALGLIVPLSILMASASLFVLLVPLAPRLMWGLAALCLVFAPTLAVIGLRHG